MSESVLVISSPSGCFDCPLFREGIVDTCFPLDRDIHDEEGGFDEYGDRPLWCPLAYLPKKKHVHELIEDDWGEYLKETDYARGWNDCLGCITEEVSEIDWGETDADN